MATNPYISRYTGEQNLVEGVTIEIIKATGQDCLYIPRQHLLIDRLFGEDPGNSLSDSHSLLILTYLQTEYSKYKLLTIRRIDLY